MQTRQVNGYRIIFSKVSGMYQVQVPAGWRVPRWFRTEASAVRHAIKTRNVFAGARRAANR